MSTDVFLGLNIFLLLSSRLCKSEEDKIELNAMLDSVQKEGLKINQTLTVRRQYDGS